VSSHLQQSASTKPGEPKSRSGPCRLLVVEDDDLLVFALTEFLEADGRFSIVGRAHDGREGVELAAALDPDVVVMDIGMPVMDGVEATRLIHAQFPSLPIVLISGLDYEEGALEGRDAGASDYVRKGRLELDLGEAILAAARQAVGRS
jgi:DNA-binding NarL/FixJ family response regulator